VSLIDRDGTSADALLTDLYLDAVMAGAAFGGRGPFAGDPAPELDPVARAAAERLRHDLVRVHPSFRFEERLATRLAEAATAMRLPTAVGAEGRVVPFRAAVLDPLARDPASSYGTGGPNDPRELARPLLIGGALTSAAISIAGAALVAWRRGRPGRTPMARAARAARAARPTRLARLD
jgi:hypothetical protein